MSPLSPLHTPSSIPTKCGKPAAFAAHEPASGRRLLSGSRGLSLVGMASMGTVGSKVSVTHPSWHTRRFTPCCAHGTPLPSARRNPRLSRRRLSVSDFSGFWRPVTHLMQRVHGRFPCPRSNAGFMPIAPKGSMDCGLHVAAIADMRDEGELARDINIPCRAHKHEGSAQAS